jgi:hypothetical protein
MSDTKNDFDFDQFLKQNPHPKHVRLVLPGAVVSGQVDDVNPKAVRLGDVTVSAGMQVVEFAFLIVPRDRILAWGKHTKIDLQNPQP